MIRAGALLLLTLAALGASLGAHPLLAADADAAALLDQGKELFEAGNISAALQRFRAAVDADPERADAQAWLGKTLLDLKRAAEAEPPLKRAVELAPSEPEFRFLLGMSFYLRADWEPARQLLEQATRLRKGNAADSYYLGRVYLNTSQQSLAEGAFRSALNADPHYLPARLHLAITLRDRGNLAEAETEFKRVLQRDASQPLPHYYLGSLQLDRGDYEAARASLEASIRLDSGFEASHFRLGLTLMNLKEFEAAAAEFQKAIDLNPYYDLAWQGLGRAYARLGRTEEAEKALARFQLLEPVGQRITFLRQVLANSPASSRARLDLAAELTKIDDLGPARELLERALEIDPEFAEAHARLGRVLALQGHTEEAAVRYYEAVRRDPGNVDYRYEFGVTLARAGYCRQAVVQFLEVVARNAEHAAAYGDLGTCYAKLGDLPRAEESLKRAAEIDPIPAGPYANLGSLYASSGRLDEAIAQYRLALQRAPEDADIRFNLGGALLEQGAFLEARTELERAAALRPEDRDMRRALARAQVRSGQGEEAVRLLSEMLRAEPNDAILISDLGAALGALGRLDAAERAHRSAIALDPRSPSHRLLFAETLARAGRGAEALAQIEEALRIAPGEPEILYRLAAARADQGDAAGATDALDRAVSAGFRDARRIGAEPAFVALRGDPRFEGVVARVTP